MSDSSEYTPPKVWTWAKPNGGRFANINRPISGPTHEKELPVGRHPLQLYSLGTPNGVKITVMLEELLALGHTGAEYDAWLIRIAEGDQFASGFVAINPNSKIPALLDRSSSKPIRVFESGAILMYLAEKFGAFLPTEPSLRAECLSWLFWQMGSTPYVGGGFGHFYAYAPTKIEYAIDRFTMETMRLLDVLDKRLADNEYLAGVYTIADMAAWPWYGGLAKFGQYGAAEFLAVHEYKNVNRWADAIGARPAVQRGRMVNRVSGEPSSQLHERHDASDFVTKTQDKLVGGTEQPRPQVACSGWDTAMPSYRLGNTPVRYFAMRETGSASRRRVVNSASARAEGRVRRIAVALKGEMTHGCMGHRLRQASQSYRPLNSIMRDKSDYRFCNGPSCVNPF